MVFTVYIFIHPILTEAKLEFYREQLGDMTNISNIVFVVSHDYCPMGKQIVEKKYIGNMINIDSFGEQMFTNISNKKSIFDNIYREDMNVVVNNYTSFFNYELVLEQFDANMFILYCEPDESVPINFTGIGCKRFFSQLYHNNFFQGSHYCAIDDLSLLYENVTAESINIRNSDETQAMVNSGHLNCITYNQAINEITEFISQNPSQEFVIGYTKGTEGNIEPPPSISIGSTSLYKFIYVHTNIMNTIFYDPFCSNFKEDVDWLTRVRIHADDNEIFYKVQYIGICKIGKQVNCWYNDETKFPYLKTPEEKQISRDVKEYINNFYQENYYNYIYFIHRYMTEYVNGLVGNLKYTNGVQQTIFLYIPQMQEFPGTPSLGINELFIDGANKIGEMGIDTVSGITTYYRKNIITDTKLQTCSMQTYNVKQIQMLIKISQLLHGQGDEFNIEYFNAISNVIGMNMQMADFAEFGRSRIVSSLVLKSNDYIPKIFEFLELLGIEESFRFKKDDIYVKISANILTKTPHPMFKNNMYENKYLKYKLKYLILNNLINK